MSGEYLLGPFRAAMLNSWKDLPLMPGAHVLFFSNSAAVALQARRAGLQLRDTFLILGTDPVVKFAFLFRKPLEEKTVTEQVLKTGTGALNIGACRVGTHTETHSSGAKKERTTMVKGMVTGTENHRGEYAHNHGRWPTNLLLVHGPNCQRVGNKKIPGHKGYPNGPGGKSYQYSSDKRGSEIRPDAWTGHADENGLETIPDYRCEPTCPVLLLNAQSGERPATLTGRADPNQSHTNPGDNGGASTFGGGNSNVYADSGGAARFYVQASNSAEMVQWLHTLITSNPGA